MQAADCRPCRLRRRWRPCRLSTFFLTSIRVLWIPVTLKRRPCRPCKLSTFFLTSIRVLRMPTSRWSIALISATLSSPVYMLIFFSDSRQHSVCSVSYGIIPAKIHCLYLTFTTWINSQVEVFILLSCILYACFIKVSTCVFYICRSTFTFVIITD